MVGTWCVNSPWPLIITEQSPTVTYLHFLIYFYKLDSDFFLIIIQKSKQLEYKGEVTPMKFTQNWFNIWDLFELWQYQAIFGNLLRLITPVFRQSLESLIVIHRMLGGELGNGLLHIKTKIRKAVFYGY